MIYSQLLRARRWFLHAVSLLQQLEELLDRDPGVRRPPEGEDLPQQDPERPAVNTEINEQLCNFLPTVT